jgi:hypothetical protein
MVSDQEELARQIHTTLRSWRAESKKLTPLRGLLLVEQRLFAGESEENATFTVLQNAMSELEQQAPERASLLRQRFEIGKKMQQVVRDETWSERSLYLKQREAIKHLADIIARQEKQLTQQRRNLLASRLPFPAYTQLVGAVPKLETLFELLRPDTPPFMVALSGMGGIGKTTLADALVRQLVLRGTYDRFAWVSAQQAVFSLGGRIMTLSDRPALTLETLVQSLATQVLETHSPTPLPHHELQEEVQHQLLAQQHLLVIDNLETVPDINHLLPFMRQVMGTTKILLTSRVQLLNEGDVFSYVVPALTREEGLELIRQEARLRNIAVLIDCDEATGQRIYDVVGGNPLALRLVAGQVHLHGLDEVLGDLNHAAGSGEQLYRYLYEWSWEHLPESCRAVLLAMPLLTESGGTLVDLVEMTELPAPEVRMALQELVTQNLVNVQGDATLRTYTIHNLTRAFLQEEIAKWL